MKKTFKIILCLALVLGSLLSLSACGGSESASAPDSSVKQSATGRYEIQSIIWDDGTEASGELLESSLAQMGETYLELYSDNTALLCLLGQRAEMEFSESNMWRAGSSYLAYEFSVKDGKATLYAEGTTYVFVKN